VWAAIPGEGVISCCSLEPVTNGRSNEVGDHDRPKFRKSWFTNLEIPLLTSFCVYASRHI
jgi:hypothetical protein